MISTVIITYNEEALLKDCLQSVINKSDEIVILDLGSTDNTLNICKEFKAKIFTHQRVNFVEKVRNLAISKAKGDWVLILDPDERVSFTLWEKLLMVVKEDKYTAINIPRKNIFFGRWINHTNWWPDRHVRFFKKGKVSWQEKIHLYPKVDGKMLDLPAIKEVAIEHFGYSTVGDFIDRQNRYSTIEAQNLYQAGERFSWSNFFWKPSREFLVRFIKHAGFLDGWHGFVLTYLMMVYQWQVMIKLWELEQPQ